MHTRLNRRGFLQGGAALAVVGGTQFFTGIPALADYAAAPALRRNAFTMASNDPILRGYRRAIKAMRALPNDNPCSWFYQAAIHGTSDPANLTAWNTCHDNPSFFWAWHRMYLYWFERIVRKQSGMYDWAIPFWDWTNPAQRAIPAPFRQSGDLLYDATRSASMNGGGLLSTSLATSVNTAMAFTDYFNAQSSINGPHGSVHVTVSGNMSSVSSAAQDPIFWAHHSQVDRLWNLWLAQGGGRSSPVGDATWRNTTYTFFDECCKQVTMKGCDVLRAALQLNYAYEGEPAQVNQYCPLKWVINPDLLKMVEIKRWPGPFPLRAGATRFKLDPRVAPVAGAPSLQDVLAAKEQLATLSIQGIEAEVQPGTSFDVFLGPPGVTPDPKGRQFLGTFALFSAGIKSRKQHYTPASFAFPAEQALVAAGTARELEVLVVPTNGLQAQATTSEVPKLAAPLAIRAFSLGVDKPMTAPPQDEQEKLRRQEAAR